MSFLRAVRLLAFAASMQALFVAPSGAAVTIAGESDGAFGVSATGAATYTFPIFAPPGPRGLQPHVSLQYNSNGGAGLLGPGWSIGGLSMIYRCPKTFAQDGNGGPVSLSATDGYCLDGNRLNTDPSNWCAVPRGLLPFLNGHRGPNYDQAHPDVRPAILMLAKVKCARFSTARRVRE